MDILIGIFSVTLIVVSILMVIAILLQEDKAGGGLGSILGGSSQSFFGASSGNFLTRITTIFLVIFFVFGIAVSILCSTATTDATITEQDIQKKQYENRTLVNTKTDFLKKTDQSTDTNKK
jgi:protein translocase SecG subunit